jgi:hypothetical protein
MDSHHFEKLDPDIKVESLGPDPHQGEKQDPDPHLHQSNADPQHCKK